jgi:hypothetical protein
MQPAPSAASVPAPRRRRTAKSFLGILLLLGAIFAAGYVPATMKNRRLEATLQTAALDLRLANLHRKLGVASQEAQRNNYASAAAAANEFFDGCRALVRDDPFDDEPRTRGAIAAYASYDDEISVMLATANPRAKERLASLYLTMDGVLQRRQ